MSATPCQYPTPDRMGATHLSRRYTSGLHTCLGATNISDRAATHIPRYTHFCLTRGGNLNHVRF